MRRQGEAEGGVKPGADRPESYPAVVIGFLKAKALPFPEFWLLTRVVDLDISSIPKQGPGRPAGTGLDGNIKGMSAGFSSLIFYYV